MSSRRSVQIVEAPQGLRQFIRTDNVCEVLSHPVDRYATRLADHFQSTRVVRGGCMLNSDLSRDVQIVDSSTTPDLMSS